MANAMTAMVLNDEKGITSGPFRFTSGRFRLTPGQFSIIIFFSEQIKTNNLYQQLVLSNPNDEMANEQMNVLYKTEVGFQISFSDWRGHPIRNINLKTMI